MFDTSLITGTIPAAIVAFAMGYMFAKTPLLGGDRSPKSKEASNKESAADEKKEQVFSDMGGDFKMVLVVRNDLKMGKGKIAAQCGHAAVGAFQSAVKKTPGAVSKWECSGQAKIAVKVDSEEAMMEIYRTARVNGLNSCLIRDAGRTQIEPNTKTVLAIGPAPNSVLDLVTGHLKLL